LSAEEAENVEAASCRFLRIGHNEAAERRFYVEREFAPRLSHLSRWKFSYVERAMKSFHWDISRTLVMGVLNVTPDSFFDGGRFSTTQHAVERAAEMIATGADIIDIGGESTRPKAAPVSEEQELRRVIPVVEKVRTLCGDFYISVDTTKAAVAERALAAGAQIINDISALRFDARMAAVVREGGAGLVLMHMQGTPQTMQENPHYADVVDEVKEFLRERVEAALTAGISRARIAVDPGIGFGKTLEHNLQLLARLEEFCQLGQPLLVGVSRKSFIGKVLGKEPSERIWGTAAAVAWSVAHGANIVRVHDVAEMKQVAQMIDAIRANQKLEVGKRPSGAH
jgi:dihydropteroate synthase